MFIIAVCSAILDYIENVISRGKSSFYGSAGENYRSKLLKNEDFKALLVKLLA